MRRLCIICPWGYPIPAVKGGAIETLMQFFIEENEKDTHFEITLLTTADDEAGKIANQYKFTKYVGFKNYEKLDICWEFFFRAIKKAFKKYIPSSYEMVQVVKYLKQHVDKYDYVILECGQSYMLPLIGKIVPKEKLLAHLHWLGDGSPQMDAVTGYVLTVSKYVSEVWSKATKCNSEKIFVWNNCYNDNAFLKTIKKEERQNLRQILGLDNQKIIIYVGRIIEGKGILELIKAFNQVSIDNIALLLVGKANFGKDKMTAFEAKVQQEIELSSKKIISLGFVKNEELYKYYCISSLMVSPSKMQEAALLVNLEAMASGIPVISTNMGGIPEYVADAGVLVDVDENLVEHLTHEISRLFSNPVLFDKYSKKAKERAQRFTRRKFYERFLEIIDDIEKSK